MPHGPAQVDLRSHRDQQPLVVPRLLDIVARAAAHRLDGAGDAAPRRHDEDGQRGIDRADPLDEVQAFLPGGRVAGVVEVEDGQIEVGRFDALDRLGRRARLDHLEAFVEEQQAQRIEDVRLVVGDQDPDWARVGHSMITIRSSGSGLGARGSGARIGLGWVAALVSSNLLFAGPHPRERGGCHAFARAGGHIAWMSYRQASAAVAPKSCYGRGARRAPRERAGVGPRPQPNKCRQSALAIRLFAGLSPACRDSSISRVCATTVAPTRHTSGRFLSESAAFERRASGTRLGVYAPGHVRELHGSSHAFAA